MREEILDLLSGKKIDTQPVFSGLIHVTAEGLEREGLIFNDIHKDSGQMANAAASTFKLGGLPSAVAPLDMYVEAEALGAPIRIYERAEFVFPQVAKPLFASTTSLNGDFFESADFIKQGRIPLVCDALRAMKADIGNEVVIGGLLPGPYSLLLFLIEPAGLFSEMKREPNLVMDALFQLSTFLAKVGHAYREAGADFITIHDMGGSPAFIGPAKYEQFVFPAEKDLIAKLPKPCVLSVCGNVTKSLPLLNQSGAGAISVDQTVELREARLALTDTMLFGNLDPVATLLQGDEAQVHEAVSKAKEAGVDAVWPGCDLVPQTPSQNIKAMIHMGM